MLAGVIAVGLDWDVPRGMARLGEDGIHYASGYPRPIEGVPLQRNLHGISFATAQVDRAGGSGQIRPERL